MRLVELVGVAGFEPATPSSRTWDRGVRVGPRNLPQGLPDSEKGEENIELYYTYHILNDVTLPHARPRAGGGSASWL
jgi:hypothetical protein